MPKITIDGKEYNSDSLSEEAKKHLNALQMVDGEIRHLQIQLGIANTARGVYVQLLKAALPQDPLDGDAIKLG